MLRSKWFFGGIALASAASVWGFIAGHLASGPSVQVDAVQVQKLQSALQRIELGIEGEAGLRRRVAAAKARLDAALVKTEQQALEIAALHEQLDQGFVRSRRVLVSEVDRAYPLLPPKLMLSVERLAGGSLQVYFGDQSARFAIGQRIDFQEGPCDCFLVLMRSDRGAAEFAFGCDEGEIAAVDLGGSLSQ